MRNFDEIMRTYGRDSRYEVEIEETSRRRAAKVTRKSDGKVIIDILQECPQSRLIIKIKPKAAILIFLIAIVVLACIIGIIF